MGLWLLVQLTSKPQSLTPYSWLRGPNLRRRQLLTRLNKDELYVPFGGCFYPEYLTMTLPVLFSSVAEPSRNQTPMFLATLCPQRIWVLSMQKAADGKGLGASRWSNRSGLVPVTGGTLSYQNTWELDDEVVPGWDKPHVCPCLQDQGHLFIK